MKRCRPMYQTQVEEEESLDTVDKVATESIDVDGSDVEEWEVNEDDECGDVGENDGGNNDDYSNVDEAEVNEDDTSDENEEDDCHLREHDNVGESDDEHSNNDSNGGEFEDNFLNDDENVYEISKVLVDEEMEQEDDDQFAGISGMHDKISNLELEEKEIEIGELQLQNEEFKLEIEKLNAIVSSYEEKNHSLKENNRLLSQENARLQAIVTQSQMLGCSNLHAVISLKKDNDVLKSKLEEICFGANFIADNDSKTLFYTGLESFQLFLTLFNLLRPLFSTTITNRPLIDEFFLTLVKLRLGVPYKDIAYRTGLSDYAVGNIFRRWIDVMSVELKPLVAWPDKGQLLLNMPTSFRKHFSKVRCIIDCFEVFIQCPTSFLARAQTYSNYKKHNTVKVLIGVSPTGSICFISEAWGGRVSDKVITQQCGFLKHVEFGDQIMAARGFNVSDDLAMCGAELLIPAFTRGKKQLSTQEVEYTRCLARVRIHVERVIGHLRKKYQILQQTLSITTIKHPSDNYKSNCLIDRILIVTAALTNLSQSVVFKTK